MTESSQLDIFSQPSYTDIRYRLAQLGRWPDQSRFPLNLIDRSVRDQVLQDLKASSRPLIVTGFASLDRIIDLLADVGSREDVRLRLLLGNEPFESRKKSFVLDGQSFPNEVREYWLKKRISLYLSAQLNLRDRWHRCGSNRGSLPGRLHPTATCQDLSRRYGSDARLQQLHQDGPIGSA